MAGRIFINYRRSEDAAWARLVYNHLLKHFSADQLFIDIDSIPPGIDFKKFLDQQVAICDVFIAIIGRTWLTVRDDNDGIRLESPADFVRVEIEAALNRNIPVIPALVNGARMPRTDQLPETLRQLASRNAVVLTHDGFERDMAGLVASLKRISPFSQRFETSRADTSPPPAVSNRNKSNAPEPAAAPKTKIGRLQAFIVALAALGAATATFIGSVGTLREAWCKNIGLLCSTQVVERKFPVASGTVSVESGGTKDNKSDECKEHTADVCIRPSASDRTLLADITRFEVSERSAGVFVDGNPTNPNPIGTSNIGWFIDGTRNARTQVCAIVYARTSACETKVFIKGRLLGEEIITK